MWVFHYFVVHKIFYQWPGKIKINPVLSEIGNNHTTLGFSNKYLLKILFKIKLWQSRIIVWLVTNLYSLKIDKNVQIWIFKMSYSLFYIFSHPQDGTNSLQVNRTTCKDVTFVADRETI